MSVFIFLIFCSNGGYVTSPKIGRYCGNRIYPIIKSDSNILMVKFRSDNSLSAPGFEINWDGTTIGKPFEIFYYMLWFWSQCIAVPFNPIYILSQNTLTKYLKQIASNQFNEVFFSKSNDT